MFQIHCLWLKSKDSFSKVGHHVWPFSPMCTGTKNIFTIAKCVHRNFLKHWCRRPDASVFVTAFNPPVKRRRVTLSFTAENHLLVLLHGVHWKHDAARLLRKHGALQSVACWETQRETAISTLHLHRHPTCLQNKLLAGGVQRANAGKPLKSQTTSRQNISINSNNGSVTESCWLIQNNVSRMRAHRFSSRPVVCF